MHAFTDLYLTLDATTSTSAKLDALAAYFASVPPADAAWAVAFLTGNRPKGTTSSRVVRTLALERAGIPAWLFDASRAAVGDMSETIALVIPEPDTPGDNTPLHRVVDAWVLPLAGASEDDRRARITEAWATLTRDELFVYLKMIRGGFRVGVQRRLLARALARVAGVEQATMEHRLAGGFDPTPDAFGRLLAAEDADERRLRPYPFYLAHPLEGDAAELGDPSEWLAEWKYDGVRAQLAKRDGAVSIWSRGEELITHQFPELVAGAAELPDETVLDGEVLLWTPADTPAPFASLQTRLNRKHAPSDQGLLFDRERPVLIAFDVLEAAGEDLRSAPQKERRRALESVISPMRDDTIRVSPLVGFQAWDELADHRAGARERGVEGLMLKHRGSPYLAGRVRPNDSPGWVKWKLDPRTADAVLVHALPGSGRRATLYTDYAFAVWSDGELVVFARAYSGLTQGEIEELDNWIRRNTRRRKGPVREVRPERVFEIGFEGIARSDRHKAGIAVRFPRILRERTDKKPEQADTIDTLRAMLPDEGRP